MKLASALRPLALCLLMAAPVSAAEPRLGLPPLEPTEPPPPLALRPPESPYTLRLDVDLALLLGGIVLWGGSSVIGASAPPPWCGTLSTAPCDPAGLNALDRAAVGVFDPRAGTAANVLVGVVPAAFTVLDIVDNGITHWRGWLTDAVVITEAVVWSGAVQDVVRRAVRRPRPYMYTPGLNPGEREGAEASFSFFSGHTSNTFAMVIAAAYTYSLRHPGSRWQYLVWTLALAGASTEPVLRVLAGGHFPTDVIVGALVGSSAGILVPALHRRRTSLRLTASVSGEQALVGLGGRF